MIRIGIVGSGSPGALSAAKALNIANGGLKSDRPLPDVKVTLIRNPNIPILSVGESVTPSAVNVLQYSFGFKFLQDFHNIDATPRYGTKNIWENGKGNDFIMAYPNNPAIHLNSGKFSPYVLQRVKEYYGDKFELIEDHVTISQNKDVVIVQGEKDTYEFDYLIDSRGWPTDEELASDEYKMMDFESVNSLFAFSIDEEDPNTPKEFWTTALFHRNGWMFTIPLTTRKTFGYLFNKNITSKKEALDHFKTLLPEVEEEKINHITWRHYYKKKAIDGRILSLGNRLYFYEPIQSLPLHFYEQMMTRVVVSILEDNYVEGSKVINENYLKHMEDLHRIIAMNYAGDNEMDSPFWKKTKEDAIHTLKSSESFMRWAHGYINGYRDYYWFHEPWIMELYMNGFNVNLQNLFEP